MPPGGVPVPDAIGEDRRQPPSRPEADESDESEPRPLRSGALRAPAPTRDAEREPVATPSKSPAPSIDGIVAARTGPGPRAGRSAPRPPIADAGADVEAAHRPVPTAAVSLRRRPGQPDAAEQGPPVAGTTTVPVAAVVPASRPLPPPLVAPARPQDRAAHRPGSALARPEEAAADRAVRPRIASASAPTDREVHVHIGRIEVTAVRDAPVAKRPPPKGRAPLSLDEYLARRQEGS